MTTFEEHFIVGKSYCTHTKQAVTSLRPPTVLYLDKLPDQKEAAAIQQRLTTKTGQSTVPYVWFEGKFIPGGNAGLQELLQKGS